MSYRIDSPTDIEILYRSDRHSGWEAAIDHRDSSHIHLRITAAEIPLLIEALTKTEQQLKQLEKTVPKPFGATR